MNFRLNIAYLYPTLMSTYGDRGNVIVLQKRCEWRGIDTEVVPIRLKTPEKDLEKCDLIFMGGAQDRQQELASKDLKNKGLTLKKMIERDVPALFVCAAYQFVGKYYKAADGTKIPGLGLLDLYTVNSGFDVPRCIGNTVIDISMNYALRTMNSKTIVGFENHGGRTYLGDSVEPLGTVIKGYGNNGEDGDEGAVYKNVIGSYFHGPLLPKNPQLADWLIAKALKVKYKESITLELLDDKLEKQSKVAMLARLNINA